MSWLDKLPELAGKTALRLMGLKVADGALEHSKHVALSHLLEFKGRASPDHYKYVLDALNHIARTDPDRERAEIAGWLAYETRH